MMITINNVAIHFNSKISPAKIETSSTEGTHFDIALQATVTGAVDNSLLGRNDNYTATISIVDLNYDLTQLPSKALVIPVILGHVNKSELTTFNFTSGIPNYDAQDFRRPYITKLRFNATDEFVADQTDALVILNTYLVVIDLSDVN